MDNETIQRLENVRDELVREARTPVGEGRVLLMSCCFYPFETVGLCPLPTHPFRDSQITVASHYWYFDGGLMNACFGLFGHVF